MASKLIRWGIASAGKISEDFVIALSTLPASDHKVVAVAARSQERAAEFAKKHEIPTALGSYEELAKNKDVGEYKPEGKFIVCAYSIIFIPILCRCGLHWHTESPAL